MENSLSLRKRRPLWVVLMALVLLLSVISIVEAATYYMSPAWIKVNLSSDHKSYGVFMPRTGHTNLRMYYMTGTNTGYLLGNSQCGAINAVTGPGYINDPSGTNSAYVPSGRIGLGICASTSTLYYLKFIKGYNINDSSRWRLYYDR